jgi:hypothetical protein
LLFAGAPPPVTYKQCLTVSYKQCLTVTYKQCLTVTYKQCSSQARLRPHSQARTKTRKKTRTKTRTKTPKLCVYLQHKGYVWGGGNVMVWCPFLPPWSQPASRWCLLLLTKTNKDFEAVHSAAHSPAGGRPVSYVMLWCPFYRPSTV